MPQYDLLPFSSDDALADDAARRFIDHLNARRTDKPFHVALSGGRIARKFFNAAVEESRRHKTTFDGVHFFWADERVVPPDDEESNFRVASELLFQPLRFSEERVHRIHGELPPPEAAQQAENEIRHVIREEQESFPIIDLVFLGMGEDGHVASLFPDASPEEVNSESIYLPVVASKPPPNRITLNYGPLSVARDVWVLASGSGKQRALEDSLGSDSTTPLGRVLRHRRHTLLFSDIPS